MTETLPRHSLRPLMSCNFQTTGKDWTLQPSLPSLIRDHPHFVNDLTCVINSVIIIIIAENVNRLSRVHERYRQTTDRQTDGRTMTYSEREHEFTFANTFNIAGYDGGGGSDGGVRGARSRLSLRARRDHDPALATTVEEASRVAAEQSFVNAPTGTATSRRAHVSYESGHGHVLYVTAVIQRWNIVEFCHRNRSGLQFKV